jgi:prepilin peptidase CpaA
METLVPMLVLTVAAAVSDLRSGKIPNPLILCGLSFGIGLSLLSPASPGPLMSLAGFATGLLLLLPGYLLHFTGAGDLKLLATLGIFGGPGILLQVFVASAIGGALFYLLWNAKRLILNPRRLLLRYAFMVQTLLVTGQPIHLPCDAPPGPKQRLPMAPFYALGCLVTLIFQELPTRG